MALSKKSETRRLFKHFSVKAFDQTPRWELDIQVDAHAGLSGATSISNLVC
jgi:hypothetical protein